MEEWSIKKSSCFKIMKILFIGHEASRSGAPILLLHLMKWLAAHSEVSMRVLLGNGGPLVRDFEAIAPTTVLREILDLPEGIRGSVPVVSRAVRKSKLLAMGRSFRAFAPDLIYVNTAVTRDALEMLGDIDAPVVLHVHELEVSLKIYSGEANTRYLLGRSDGIIAVSEAVRENLVASYGVSNDDVDLVHEFIPTVLDLAGDHEVRRARLCAKLGLDPGVQIVGGAGTISLRKGTDLFVLLAREILSRDPESQTHFLWVGGELDSFAAEWFLGDVRKAGLSDRVHFIGSVDDPESYIDLFDVFAMVSREDPYPLVMLEAAAAGKPIVCFAGAGGTPEFVEADSGSIVPYMDIAAMAGQVTTLLQDDQLRARMGESARLKVRTRHDIDTVAPKILAIINRHRRSLRSTANGRT